MSYFLVPYCMMECIIHKLVQKVFLSRHNNASNIIYYKELQYIILWKPYTSANTLWIRFTVFLFWYYEGYPESRLRFHLSPLGGQIVQLSWCMGVIKFNWHPAMLAQSYCHSLFFLFFLNYSLKWVSPLRILRVVKYDQ